MRAKLLQPVLLILILAVCGLSSEVRPVYAANGTVIGNVNGTTSCGVNEPNPNFIYTLYSSDGGATYTQYPGFGKSDGTFSLSLAPGAYLIKVGAVNYANSAPQAVTIEDSVTKDLGTVELAGNQYCYQFTPAGVDITLPAGQLYEQSLSVKNIGPVDMGVGLVEHDAEAQYLKNPSFESNIPGWTDKPVPPAIRDIYCNMPGLPARTDACLVVFGDTLNTGRSGSIEQSVLVPMGTGVLDFWYQINTGAGGTGTLTISVGGDMLWRADETQAGANSGVWQHATVLMDKILPGEKLLKIASTSDKVEFHLDDVEMRYYPNYDFNWLAVTMPSRVPSGTTVQATLKFNTSTLSPGVYKAWVAPAARTAIDQIVPVNLTVTDPSQITQGIRGTAKYLDACLGQNLPAMNTRIQAWSGANMTAEAYVNSAGNYNLALPAGTYTLKADAPDYTPYADLTVTVSNGAFTTQNYVFEKQDPCFTVTPQALTESMLANTQWQRTLTVGDTGNSSGFTEWLELGLPVPQPVMNPGLELDDASWFWSNTLGQSYRVCQAGFGLESNCALSFGRPGVQDSGYQLQKVSIPAGIFDLRFKYRVSNCVSPSSRLTLFINATQVWEMDGSSLRCGQGWQEQTLVKNSYSFGQQIELIFWYSGTDSQVDIDNVTITAYPELDHPWITNADKLVSLGKGESVNTRVQLDTTDLAPDQYQAFLSLRDRSGTTSIVALNLRVKHVTYLPAVRR